jgi:hypothetical protein
MCDCIETTNKHLAEFNTKIELPLWTSSGARRPFVLTMKVDEKKRGRPRMIFASCCPFCGERYAEPGTEQTLHNHSAGEA